MSDLHINANANALAAYVAGLSPEMDVAAEKVRGAIRAKIAPDTDTGDFSRSIKIDRVKYKSVTDRMVYSDDPGAFAIEFGFRDPKGKAHPGKFIFTDIARKGL